jgi:short-subunit dehydrogenase
MDTINKQHRNEYALVTGATSGIGYELAKLFAADGYNLVLVARNQERLQEITDELKQQFSVEITPLVKDLFKREAAREIFDKTQEMGITVNVLVNDAGQGEWGKFLDTDLQRELDIIQLNISSLVSLTKFYLKDMVNRNEGKILQLGSEAGKTPIPLFAVYAATKAFVLSFSAALANELKDTNITITALLPGATDTDFFHKASMEDSKTYREEKLLPPEQVAKDGYEALMKGESKIISGAKTKMHVFMADVLGDKMSAENNRKLMEPSKKSPEKGRKRSEHEASRKERQSIAKQTGDQHGDYEHAESDGEQKKPIY